MTRAKNTSGCSFSENYPRHIGSQVDSARREEGEYGALIGSRCRFHACPFLKKIGHLPSRVVSIELTEPPFEMEIVGIPVPSRGDNTP